MSPSDWAHFRWIRWMTSSNQIPDDRKARGIPPRRTPETEKTNRPSNRWDLSNAIDDRLGWMPHPEYRVLRVLFRHIGTTGKAWPGQTRIAGACGLNRGHVSRLLNRLERWGVVEVPRRGHMKSRKAAEYRIRSPSKWPTEKPPD